MRQHLPTTKFGGMCGVLRPTPAGRHGLQCAAAVECVGDRRRGLCDGRRACGGRAPRGRPADSSHDGVWPARPAPSARLDRRECGRCGPTQAQTEPGRVLLQYTQLQLPQGLVVTGPGGCGRLLIHPCSSLKVSECVLGRSWCPGACVRVAEAPDVHKISADSWRRASALPPIFLRDTQREIERLESRRIIEQTSASPMPCKGATLRCHAVAPHWVAHVSILRHGQSSERADEGHTTVARCYTLASSPSYPGQLTHKALPPRTGCDTPSVPLDTVPLDNSGLNSILDGYRK